MIQVIEISQRPLPTQERRLHLFGMALDTWPDCARWDSTWLSSEEAETAYQECLQDVSWQQESLRFQDKIVPLPRRTAWMGDPGSAYRYSGLQQKVQPWSDLAARLRDRLEQTTGVRFNSVLFNHYRDGRDSVSWHADDEPELGQEPIIASVSLGAPRRFCWKQRAGGGKGEILLTPGSLLVMHGRSQADWQHAIPKTTRPVGSRINLTFRCIR